MTAAKVFVVAWELQESENGEVCGVVGVYATESSAMAAALEEAEDWMKATFWDSPVICIDGNVRYPEGQRGEKCPSWDVWITTASRDRQWRINGEVGREREQDEEGRAGRAGVQPVAVDC